MRSLALIFLVVATLPAAAFAKPWQGIEPGVSKRADVVKKFGEPSKVVTNQGKDTLAYLQETAIKGTKQAQFRVDTATGVVERIDVFPGPVIDKDTVEATYGPACAAATKAEACYQKKLTDDFRTYFLYPSLGLAIFFNEDGKTVQSFIFQPVKTK